MTADDVRAVVVREIAGDWSRTNAHGCDFKRCLVTPHLEQFENFGGPGASGAVKLWVVLEEEPETRDGYKVVFEEEAGMFGLASAGNEGPFYLGKYGTFIEAFDAM